MQINFTGRNFEVTQSLKSYTEDKFIKLERHFDKITSIHVTLDVEKLSQIAEATIMIAKGELHARSESENMYASIDDLIDKLDRQILKHKEKIRDHHRDEN
ncbi:MAG: ribosome-associated translation inhibitor RaiA [Proteobacteria bacterium]|nr:ribosome-associated translation inhibitor RaiA [Pseudomonadota bacterium]